MTGAATPINPPAPTVLIYRYGPLEVAVRGEEVYVSTSSKHVTLPIPEGRLLRDALARKLPPTVVPAPSALAITEQMIDAAQRATIRYTVAENEGIKPEDVTDEAIDAELAEIREIEAHDPDEPKIDEFLRIVLEAAMAAGLNAAEVTP